MPKLEISARTLFAYLEPGQTFNGWIKDATELYGYESGEDWIKTVPIGNMFMVMYGKYDYLLSDRFADAMCQNEYKRREKLKKRSPVVEYVYPYPGELTNSVEF